MNMLFCQSDPNGFIDALMNGKFPTPLAAITVAGLIMGRLLKAWPQFPNKWIPMMVALSGSLADCIVESWDIRHAIYGFMWGGGATFLHQLYTQTLSPPAVPTKVELEEVTTQVADAIKAAPVPAGGSGVVSVEIKSPVSKPQKQ